MLILTASYALLALVALTNLALMVRPSRRGEGPEVAFLIPARNEAHNLPHLLPHLAGCKVYVFDDESEDGTGEVARSAGAIVIRAAEPLPEGWTGKNRACHELAKVAAEDFSGDWIVFLDADVRPGPGFVADLRSLLADHGRRYGVVTAMPSLHSASAVEAAYMNWVVWIILATNPFGLVARSGMGHNHFLNGQLVAWKVAAYFEMLPHQELRSVILEDVRIGRLLARRKVPVLVADLSRSFRVKMYESFAQAWDGMAKNSFEIAGSSLGTALIGLLMIGLAWAWLPAGLAGDWRPALAFGLCCLFVHVLARRNPLLFPLWPVSLTLGGATFFRSIAWRKAGRIAWKGRVYRS